MEKFVPYHKLSKKKKREIDSARRGTWYGINPVTRKPENSRAYNRRKARTWSDDSLTVLFFCGEKTGWKRGKSCGMIKIMNMITESEDFCHDDFFQGVRAAGLGF